MSISEGAPIRFVSVQLARNAWIGSMREALRTGISPATAATAINSIPIPINVIGSAEFIPIKRLCSAPVRTRDAAISSISPRAANPSVGRKIRLCRCLTDAPSAMRIAISCDSTEDRGSGADTEAGAENRKRRKSCIAPHLARRLMHILPETAHPADYPHGAGFFCVSCHILPNLRCAAARASGSDIPFPAKSCAISSISKSNPSHSNCCRSLCRDRNRTRRRKHI